MNENDTSIHNASLEEHLTNSIRRAREKIYNHMGNSYSASNQFTLSQLQDSTPTGEMRNRTNSQRHPLGGSRHREEKSVLASAMKTLQEKIQQLEMENKELRLRSMQAENLKETGKHRSQKEQIELARLVTSLREREAEVKKMARENSELNQKNLDLNERVQDLQQEMERLSVHREEVNNGKDDYLREKDTQRIIEQEEKITQLERKVAELHRKNMSIEQSNVQLSKKLEEERKINMRWIKLQECQFGDGQQKQNNGLTVNVDRPIRTSHFKKQQLSTLQKKNKEMYETIQRNKAKIADLTRECKHHEQKFNEMKLIALEVAEAVNKILPNQPSHIKYLTTKILKLENSHVESLRSFSNVRRSRVMERNSNSKQRKRSLKMSDLASSAKKSREGSNSKSHKKRQINEQQITRSQKKTAPLDKPDDEVQELEKQVLMLKKKYRNFIARAEKDQNNQDINRKIEEISKQYNDKKEKLDQMKKHINAPAKLNKKEVRD